MSIEHVYLLAEQSITQLASLCALHEIVLSRKVLCRALAIQIAEELDAHLELPVHFATMTIPELLEFITNQQMLLDLYALKLKLWMVLYTNRETLHLEDSFVKPVNEPAGDDTLDQILQVGCFQDGYGEWMGQWLPLGTVQESAVLTPKVDVISVNVLDIPVYEEEEFDHVFGDNTELASLVSDVLAAETSPKKRRNLFASLRKK